MTTELAALLRAVPAARPPEPLPTASDDPRAIGHSLLREVRQARGGRQVADLVRSRLQGVDQPWTVLRNWVLARVPGVLLRPAVAAALSVGIPGDGARDDCTAWLIADAWDRRAFVAAALMAPYLSSNQASLAGAAAAAPETGPLDAFLSDLAPELTESTAEGDPAFAVTAAASIAESLLWSNPDGCVAADLLSPRLPEGWRAFTDVVVASYQPSEGELPLRTVLHEQTRLSVVAELEAERAHILELVAKIEQIRYRFAFPAGRVLYADLFSPGGLLTRVQTAAGTDLEAVAALHPSLPGDVRGYLDRIISQAANVDPMVWSSQLGWLRNVEEIISACRRIGPEALALYARLSRAAGRCPH